MSYFTTSALLAGQAKFTDRMTSGEWRLPDSVAFNAAAKSLIANPSLADLRTREDRSVYAYFPIRQAATTGTSRAYAHTGALGDSLSKTITWSTFSEPFSISIKQADNNVFSFSEMYASSLQNAILNLINRADAWFVAALITDKTQYSAGGGKGVWNGSSLNTEVPLSEQNYLFQNIRQLLEYNLYKGQLIVIADDYASVLSQRLMALGSGNAINYGFQFAGMDVLTTTRTILGTTNYSGSSIAYQNGLVAVEPWIPKQNRKALDPEKAVEYNGDYGQFFVPSLPGVPFAIHSYALRADQSNIGGYNQDVLIQLEVSFDLAYVSAPISTFRSASDSVVYTIGQLSA
jgi:hypothetical protein